MPFQNELVLILEKAKYGLVAVFEYTKSDEENRDYSIVLSEELISFI